jgi:hypothetical protein
MRGSLVLNTPRVPLGFNMLEIWVPCICSVTGNPDQADHSSSLTTQVRHAVMGIIWIQKLQQVQQQPSFSHPHNGVKYFRCYHVIFYHAIM